jgi:hypothetical protein
MQVFINQPDLLHNNKKYNLKAFLNIFLQKMGVYNIKAVIWAIMPQPRMDAILQVGFSCQQCADVLFKRALTLYSIDL